MKNRFLTEYVKLVIEGINQPYDTLLSDDESVKERSVIVPDDIKDKIFDYLKSMGLSNSD